MSTLYTVAGRRVVIHDREEWQLPSRPVTGPSPYPDLVHHFVVHWPGASTNWVPPLDTASHLRWAQDMYLLDPNRGYSYGYGFVVGRNPIDWDADPIVFDTWEVRGFDIRIASNDGDHPPYGDYTNPNFNGRSISGQIMSSVAHPATDDQIQQMRYLVAIADQRYGETLGVIPHYISDATSCPYPYISERIGIIATRPVGSAPTPTPAPPPTTTNPTGAASMGAPLIIKFGYASDSTATNKWAGYFSFDGISRHAVRGMHHARQLVRLGAVDAKTGSRITSDTWDGVTFTKDAEELDEWLTPGRD